MRIRSVIFDLDGTLLNTLDDLADACNRALARMGHPLHPTDAYRHFIGNGARMLCTRMLPEEVQSEEAERAHALFDEEYRDHMFDKTAPYPGIPALLEELVRRELLLGVVSNKPDIFVQSIVERYFPGVFRAVSGPRDGHAKPDPAGVLSVLERFGVPPEEALYVGDSDVDMLTARNAGVHSCGVLWGFRDRAELSAAGAEHLIREPGELLALLERKGEEECG